MTGRYPYKQHQTESRKSTALNNLHALKLHPRCSLSPSPSIPVYSSQSPPHHAYISLQSPFNMCYTTVPQSPCEKTIKIQKCTKQTSKPPRKFNFISYTPSADAKQTPNYPKIQLKIPAIFPLLGTTRRRSKFSLLTVYTMLLAVIYWLLLTSLRTM